MNAAGSTLSLYELSCLYSSVPVTNRAAIPPGGHRPIMVFHRAKRVASACADIL